jgi:hypothetical protein
MATFPAFFENIEMRLFSSALPKLGWSTAASGGDMAGCEADKVLDAPLRTIVGCLAEVLPIGPAQTALYWVAGLCILAAPFIYKYYLGILAQGAQPEGSIERQDYDKLRASLAGGNLAGRLYTKWLTAFLDGVERFFGDKGMANRTLFPRAFGLKTPAPLWTAPAFDRCLLLALIYPIATIFVIWAISGDVGPAEAALGLKRDLQFWRRGLAVAAIGFATFASWRSWLALNSKRGIGWVGVVVPAAAIVAGAAASDFAFDVVTTIATTFSAIAAAIAADFAFVGAVAVGAAVGAAVFTAVGAVSAGAAGTAVVSIRAVAFGVSLVFAFGVLSITAVKREWRGLFLVLFLPAMIAVCLTGAEWLSPIAHWDETGPLLLFLGLLTLLNAPFDWASLGLTRALLRRGSNSAVGGLTSWRSRTRLSPPSSLFVSLSSW